MPPPGVMLKLKFENANSQTIRPTKTTDTPEPTAQSTPLEGLLTLASSGAGLEPVYVGSSTPKVENGLVAGVRTSSHDCLAATCCFASAATDGITVVRSKPISPSSASKSSSATGAEFSGAEGSAGSSAMTVVSAASRDQEVVVCAFGITTGTDCVTGDPFAAAIRCSLNSSAL